MTGLPLNCAATLLGVGTFWLTPPPFFLALRRSRYEYPQRPTDLNQHKREFHSSDNLVACSLCDKEIRPRSLVKHMQIHTGKEQGWISHWPQRAVVTLWLYQNLTVWRLGPRCA